MKNKKFIKTFTIFFGILFWTAVWWGLSLYVNNVLLLPSPYRVLKRLCTFFSEKQFWITVSNSVFDIFIGYISGLAVGILLAVLTSLNKYIDYLFLPLGAVIRATPVASFIILALVWFRASRIPSFIAFLMVVPIVWNSLKSAVLSTDKGLIEAASVYRLGKFKTLRAVYLPHIKPHFISSAVTSLGLSWKAGIAAEVLCRPGNSIGTMVYESKIYLETVDLFAWTLTVILISVFTEIIIKSVLNVIGNKK